MLNPFMDKFTTETLQAANTLCSHLKANGVEATRDGSIVTITTDSGQHQICIGTGYNPETKQLDIADLRSNKQTRLKTVFDYLKEYTGVLVDMTTHRVHEDNWKKGTLKNNFEAVLFREKTFRNAPNPDPVVFKRLEPVAVKYGRKLFFKYRKHMLAFGYESEDFESIARVHLITFIHRYMTGDEAEDNKNLSRFMKQRMTEIVYKIIRKSDACISGVSQRVDWDPETNLPHGTHAMD
jgi:hypothetical protein